MRTTKKAKMGQNCKSSEIWMMYRSAHTASFSKNSTGICSWRSSALIDIYKSNFYGWKFRAFTSNNFHWWRQKSSNSLQTDFYCHTQTCLKCFKETVFFLSLLFIIMYMVSKDKLWTECVRDTCSLLCGSRFPESLQTRIIMAKIRTDRPKSDFGLQSLFWNMFHRLAGQVEVHGD